MIRTTEPEEIADGHLAERRDYRVEAADVDEVAAGSGGPFRGFYHLDVTSTARKAVELEPLRSTEP